MQLHVCKHIHLIHKVPKHLNKNRQKSWQPNRKTSSEIAKYFDIIDTVLLQLPESKHNMQHKLYQLRDGIVVSFPCI